MNKTISINLGGFFFHIDEDAYQKLSRYFDAVKRSLSADGRDEIMKDIESRIAELFQERLKNDKQVVGLTEIEEVISIMGQPEDYKIDDEKSTYQSSSSSSTNFYYPSKRLYRDKENGMLGGVMAGLGHYLGIDTLWLRIIMVILFFGFGTGLFVYIVLWILVPEAVTTTQKLEMKGEPITISNIEKKVKEGFDDITSKFSNIDHEKIANTAKSGATRIGSTIEEVITTIFKVFAKIIGAFIVFFSGIGLLGIIITSIIMIFSSTMPDNYILNHINTPIGLETPLWAQGMLLLLGFGIPLFFLLILGLKLMVNNLRSIGNYVKYSLLAVWLIAVGIIISLGINLTVIEISKGRIIKSSKYPKNGIKSGIKSIGEKAYTIIIPAKSFAIKGVSLILSARIRAGISRFNLLALRLKSNIYHPPITNYKLRIFLLYS